MKRIQVLLAAFVAGAMLCASPSARAEAYYDDGTYTWTWEWNENEDGVVLTGMYDYGAGDWVCGVSPEPTGKVTVPAFVKVIAWDDGGDEYEQELPVTDLGYLLFRDCTEMTEVVLPDGIRRIEESVFSCCTSLATINVPASLTWCHERAFYGTAWLENQTGGFVTFGPTLIAYQGTNEVAKIPDGIAVIGEGAFSWNETLTTVEIPASVKEIGNEAFAGCLNLATVTGANGLERCGYRAFSETAFWDEAGTNAPVRVGSAIVGYKGTLPEELVIEDGVLCIADEAFTGCFDFRTVSFPASLRRIGSRAFAYCSFGGEPAVYQGQSFSILNAPGDLEPPQLRGLAKVTLTATLQSIGEEAFAGCYALEEVAVEDSPAIAKLDSVSDLFSGSPIRNLTVNLPFVGNAFTGIGYGTLESLTFGDDVVRIGGYKFMEEGECFGCGLMDKEYEVFAEYGTLTNITFGASLESIGPYAFSKCWALPSVTIPASVTDIDDAAFAYCKMLADVEFEGDMDAIEMNLFSAFEATLWLMDYLDTLPVPENDDFVNAILLAGCPISVIGTNVNATAEEGDPLADEFESEATVWWKWTAEADGWMTFDTFGSNFDTVMGVCTLGPSNTFAIVATNDDFDDRTSCVTFKATAGTTYYIEVGGYDSAMGEIVLNGYRYQLEIDEDGVLYGYRGVPSGELVIPDGVTSIGEYAFCDCEALTSVTIPASVTSIGEGAFAACVSLANVEFEGDMDEIDMDVFGAFAETPWLAEAFPAPENDDFANAELLEGEAGSVEGTLQYATVETGDCTLDFTDPRATVWYKWKAPFTGTVLFTADAADEEDSWLFRLIAAHGRANGNGGDDEEYGSGVSGSGSDVWGGGATGGDSGEEVELDDCWFYDTDWVAFDVVEGETYYVSVVMLDDEDVDAVGSGDFTLSWEQFYRPENDNFADAIALSGESVRATGTSILATAEEGDPLADDFGCEATVWWKWTAEADGWMTFDSLGSDFDPVIGVYTLGPSNTFENVAISEYYEGCVALDFETTAGTTYYIEVGGCDSAMGEIVLNGYRYQLDIDEDGVLYGYRGVLPRELVIPEGVTEIAEYVFSEHNLVSVTLPASLEYIGDFAFAWSTLENVDGLRDDIALGTLPFRSTPFNDKLPFRFVMEGNVVVGFEGTCPAVLEIPEGVAAIEESAFDFEANGYSAVNPNYVPDAGPTNVADCVETNSLDCIAAYDIDEEEEEWIWVSSLSNLTEVRLPASMVTVGQWAFYGCENLTTVTIANPDVNIDWTAFNECVQLKTIALEKRGYVQTGWQLTFDAPAYIVDTNEWEVVRENPVYAAGETLSFPVADLSFLISRIVVTNADGVVGWLVSQEEREGRRTGYCSDEEEVYTYWETVPAWVNAVWERSTPEIFEGEDDDAFAGNAQYTGWLRDADYNLVGTITVKAAKPNAKTKATKLTATVIMLADGKKLTFTGTAIAGQLANVTLSGKSGSMNVTLSDDSVTGTFGNLTIEAAKNVFTSKASDDKASANIVPKKTWTATLVSTKGYTSFTITVGAKGKTKVTGVLPDGTKVSVSAQAVVGDGGRWAVPVMYAKKCKFGFVVWFEKGADGQTALTDISDLTPLSGPKGAVTEWEAVLDACGPVSSLAAGSHTVTLFSDPALPGLQSDLLPDGEALNVVKGKWSMAKAAKVAYKKGVLTVTPATKGGAVQNAAGAKLTFTAKTATFKGSFTAYSVKGGKLVKTKFTVNGAVVNGVAYGTAFNKTAGSIPLMVK